jgi:phosphoribulokinase
MSVKHPVISITGSSGAGTTFVKRAFEKVFNRENLKVAVVEGDSFHKYERAEMREKVAESRKAGHVLTHFAEDANHFDKLADLFKQYGETGSGQRRYYIHSDEEAVEHNARLGTNLAPGQFTPWEDIPAGTDLMFYEGLHGGVKTEKSDVAQYADLLVGVVPCVNIEWIQKIYRDTAERPYTPQQVADVILDRMPDYVKFITPQFDRTHINFHRVPLVDTANPFATDKAKPVTKPEDSLIVTTVRIPGVDLAGIAAKLPADAMAFMQNGQTLVYKGNYMIDVMDMMLSPIIKDMMAKARA